MISPGPGMLSARDLPWEMCRTTRCRRHSHGGHPCREAGARGGDHDPAPQPSAGRLRLAALGSAREGQPSLPQPHRARPFPPPEMVREGIARARALDETANVMTEHFPRSRAPELKLAGP